MNRKTTGIVSYFTVVGWLIAFCFGDRENAGFHLNQSLVLHLCLMAVSVISRLPFVGGFHGILHLLFFAFWIVGLVHACNDRDAEVPLIGGIHILR